MQEDFGGAFDGDRAKVVWSLGLSTEGRTAVPQPNRVSANDHAELQLISEEYELDQAEEAGTAQASDTAGQPAAWHSSTGQKREIPRSFAITKKTQAQGKKKCHSSMRALGAISAPSKQADAKSVAALLRGVKCATPSAQQPAAGAMGAPSKQEDAKSVASLLRGVKRTTPSAQQPAVKPPELNTTRISPGDSVMGRGGNDLASTNTPVAGLRAASPKKMQNQTAPRPLRGLNAPPTGMTMGKLFAKRSLPPPGEGSGTPGASGMPGTPGGITLTPGVAPQSSLVDCATPLSAFNHRSTASAVTPTLGTATPSFGLASPILGVATPALAPGSTHRNQGAPPATLAQSGRFSGARKAQNQGFRSLPGAAVMPSPLRVGGDDELTPGPSGTSDAKQRKYDDLFAGVRKQV